MLWRQKLTHTQMDTANNHKPNEDVEIGQLFKIIGKGFENMFRFIGSVFNKLQFVIFWKMLTPLIALQIIKHIADFKRFSKRSMHPTEKAGLDTCLLTSNICHPSETAGRFGYLQVACMLSFEMFRRNSTGSKFIIRHDVYRCVYHVF